MLRRRHSPASRVCCGLLHFIAVPPCLFLLESATVPGPEVFEIETTSERDESRSGIRWDWLIIASAAWVLFDIFTQPALAVAVASFKFGWNDFINGLWLWSRDADRKRGQTHLVFYCAAGFWRITVTTLVIVVTGLLIWAIITGIQGQNAQNNDAGWETAGVSTTIVCLGFVLSSVTTWLAMLLAWRRRHRIWLHSDISIDRSQKHWPPRPFGTNQASQVITSSLIFLAVITVIGSIVVMASSAGNVGGNPNTGPLIVATMLAGMIGSAILILVVRERALKRLTARSPMEAWPDAAPAGADSTGAASEATGEPDRRFA